MPPKLIARLKITKSLVEIWKEIFSSAQSEIFSSAQSDPNFQVIVHPPKTVVTESEESDVSRTED